MKPIKLGLITSIVLAVGLVVLAINKRAAAAQQNETLQHRLEQIQKSDRESRPPASRHQSVILHAQEYYTYGQTARDTWTNSYAGFKVYNSSSSPGAPVFPNAAHAYISGNFTNEFGQVQQSRSVELTEPAELGDAIAQLLEAGFRLVSTQTPSDQYGYAPTLFIFVKP
jgi:hypothetical protein